MKLLGMKIKWGRDEKMDVWKGEGRGKKGNGMEGKERG